MFSLSAASDQLWFDYLNAPPAIHRKERPPFVSHRSSTALRFDSNKEGRLSNENQSGLSAAVRQPQKNPIPYKSIPKSANSTREIPQSGVNSRIPESESRCTGVPKCRPSEK